MRKVLIFGILVILLSLPAGAMELEAPPAPESAQELLPETADSFGEGLWNVIRAALKELDPALHEAAGTCLGVFAAMLIPAVAGQLSTKLSAPAVELAAVAAVSLQLLEPSASLVQLGVDTVTELRSYGTLLLGVMTAALAARGGVTSSTALYAGTAFFDTALSSVMSKLLVPILWMVLALGVASAAVGEPLLEKLRDFLKWAAEWVLKLGLYLFTGFITITGVISGTADAAASKAARIAISGAVPVVGGILADATDAVLVSAEVLGSSAGIWGILTVLAIFAIPFLRLGVQYLLLKLTAALGESLGGRSGAVIGDFAWACGVALGMIGTQTVLLLISTVCFLRGTGG